MPKYRKKPVLIEATQFDVMGPATVGVCHCGQLQAHVHTIHGATPDIPLSGQVVFLEDGDWVVPEPDGVHYYPVKPDIFAERYELVDTLEDC